MPVTSLARRVLAFDPRAVARAMTLAESQRPEGRELIKAIYPKTGRALVVGVTGSPGAGKSTLTDGLIQQFRKAKKRVGVVAVDPTSAFTGGAILGDRVRMQKHATDNKVYIRSMATRGEMGGLAPATLDVVDILDAAGCDVVLIETVGVGQDEVEIVHSAHVVLVVLTPGMGDDVQAIKAGIMEIADLFVINKADQPGADRLEARLGALFPAAAPGTASDSKLPAKHPEILKTIASTGQGLEALFDSIGKKDKETRRNAVNRKRRDMDRSANRLMAILKDVFFEHLLDRLPASYRDTCKKQVAGRRHDPYTVAERMFARMVKKEKQ